jgi:hypothetical protein
MRSRREYIEQNTGQQNTGQNDCKDSACYCNLGNNHQPKNGDVRWRRIALCPLRLRVSA